MSIARFEKLLDSSYSNFKDFHTRVLKPAQKEINQYSDIIFDYEIIKGKMDDVFLSVTGKKLDGGVDR